MRGTSPVLMIGLDASELTLIEEFWSEGRLQTLQSLRERGCFGRLRSHGVVFSGGVWPTFYTSKLVPWHGIYHNRMWRRENLRVERVDETWLPERPFWEIPSLERFRVAVLDVPFVVRAPKPLNGIHVNGWGTHDMSHRGSWPPELWGRLEAEFGLPKMPREHWGAQTAQVLLQLREDLLRTTAQMAELCESTLTRESWDLFLVVLGTTHRGGHYLWDLSQIDETGLASERRQALRSALRDIYQVCDDFLARLLDKAPRNARVLVFAVHGMGPNPGWSERCQDIVSMIQRSRKEIPKSGLLYDTLKKVIPLQIRQRLRGSLPGTMGNRLSAIRSMQSVNWRTVRYFPLPMDLAGYVRINLRGREPLGTVEPGKEYHDLCQELQEAFLSLRDTETGEPIAKKVYQMDDLAPHDAPYREVLPDLVVVWGDISTTQSAGVRSAMHGEMRLHGKLPSGRSGNHSDSGWFVATGGGIPPATRADGHHVIDLVPTVLQWLGTEPPADAQGKPIPALCTRGSNDPR